MNWIISRCLKARFIVLGIAAVVMLFGVLQLPNMPVDALPEFSPPTVQVQTEALGLSASEVEELITLNLEELLSNTPFLQTIRSTSVPGLSSITLVFEPGTDILRARQLVSEKLSLAFALPNVSKPPTILPPTSTTSRVMMIGLTSRQVSPIQMSVLARWTIQPALLSVPGVANVAIWGMRDYQMQVLVDPQRLKAQNVTLDQVIATTGNALWVSPLTFLNASSPGTGGFIDSPQQRLEVRHVFPITTPGELAKVSIGGTKLHLGDVANVVEDHPPLIGDDRINNDAGLLIVVDKLPGANTLDVTRGIEEKLQALQPGLVGIHINSTVYQPASFIDTAMSNLTSTLFIVALLVLLALFLYQWRLALICLIAVPLSIVAAAVVLYLRGSTLNIMVLAGFSVALVVILDDIIVDVEHVIKRFRQYRQEGSDKSVADIVLASTLEMRSSLLYAVIIILLALVPIFFMTGISGDFFQPLAISYALALIASMAVALTITPILCLLFLSRWPVERHESALLSGLHRRYASALAWFIRTPQPAFVAFAVFLLLGMITLPFLQQQLLPTFKEPDIVVQWNSAPGTSYPEMNRITARASSELRAIPGVRNVAALIGRAVLGDQVVDVNSAQLVVSIDPSANYDATLATIQKTINGYPGIHHVVRTYLNDTVKQTLMGTSDDIVVRIYGNDLGLLRSKAAEVQHTLAKINGAANVRTEPQIDVPEIQVKVNLDKAKQYGLEPGDIRRIASTFVAGLEAGNLFEAQKVFSVVVMGTPNTRNSVTSVKDLLINTPSGGVVRLGDVADVTIAQTPEVIKHDAVSRSIDVSLTTHGRSRSDVLNDVKQQLQGIALPQEFHTEIMGDYDALQASHLRLLGFGIAAAIAIFLLLQIAFSSWRLATLFFFTVPLALVGGICAVFLSGKLLTLGSLIGLLAVFAITVRQSILLFKQYQDLQSEEGEMSGATLIVRGAQERLQPILLTTLVVGLAMLALVISGNRTGLELEYPMALAILGGLVTSTALILFVIPSLYLWFGLSAAKSDLKSPSSAKRSQADAIQ